EIQARAPSEAVFRAGPSESGSAVLCPAVVFRKHGVKEVQRVDGRGKARKDDRVDDDLFDFAGREADVEGRGEVDPELGLPAAQCGEHGGRGDLAVAESQALAAVEVTVGELDHVAPEVTEGLDGLPSVDPVDLAHLLQTALVTVRCRNVCHLNLLCLSSKSSPCGVRL